ncbi:MAG: adenylyltransferase/cytidyltransferase family protein, partial [Bdellovibrionales bacterium]|nr:adenylyltransferase/cytidyltransferase family protein [Bdellovibrionales bacterium]
MRFYKVREWSDLKNWLDKARTQKKVVFTNGCFDLLHIGHIRYLAEAKKQGDLLIVGINSDTSVKKLKGPERPIQPEMDRAEILSHLKSVDATCVFEQETPLELIQ